MRIAIGRWLTAAVFVGALLAATSPAITAQAAVGDESQICLTNAPSYCIEANGAGLSVTITNVAADKANFTVVYDSGTVHAWQDGNGNCLREGTDDIVKIENGPCNAQDLQDLWQHSQGSTTWYSRWSGLTMYVNSDANGDYVLTAVNPPSGSWSKWNAPT